MPIIVTSSGIEQFLTRQQVKLMVKPELPVQTRYVHQDYPRWVKQPDGGKTLVKSAEEEARLRASCEPRPQLSNPAPELTQAVEQVVKKRKGK